MRLDALTSRVAAGATRLLYWCAAPGFGAFVLLLAAVSGSIDPSTEGMVFAGMVGAVASVIGLLFAWLPPAVPDRKGGVAALWIALLLSILVGLFSWWAEAWVRGYGFR